MALSVLRVQLLGTFSLTYDDSPIRSVHSFRLQSVLAYLLLHADTPQPRQHIAFLLWPDTDEFNARNNLRQFLHQLRQALPDPSRFLVSDSNIIHWRMDHAQVIDIQLFEHALRDADNAEQDGDWNKLRQALTHAVSYYQGDLLPGCYDEWIVPERDRLQRECHKAYQKLVRVLERQRDYPAALEMAQHLLRLDPLDEGMYETILRLHILNENRLGAQRVYESAMETLRRELGAEPSNALRAAYERLKNTPRTISRLTAVDTPGTAPSKLIGRQTEWETLHAAWRRAANGDSHLVLIMGEAGIGKSRLAEELVHWAGQQGFATAHTRSYAAEGRLALAPVTEWLRSGALRSHIASLDPLWLTEITRLLPELLTERAELTRPVPITEYGQRQRFFEALARAVLSAPRPMILWIDDLQWCDAETFEWLHFFLRFEPGSSVLLLGTARSEESPPDHPLVAVARQLRSEGKLTSIELSPLDAAETSRLAAQIGGRELETQAAIRLYRETEGNPLFVVETVRAEIGSIVDNIGPNPDRSPAHDVRTLPPCVYAVFAGRLAQLSASARQVVELGAAIGRAFPLELLQRAGNQKEEYVIRALDELWQKRIVRELSANLFDFTHDKLREVAYMEISAPKRRLLHRRIAQALEELNSENLDSASTPLAAQYEQAGLFEQAIPYYQRAGALASNVYANDDAINLLMRGLTLLSHLPPGGKRDAQELALLRELAPLYRVTKGWATPELEEMANRARQLGEKVGDAAVRIETLYMLVSVYLVAGKFEQVMTAKVEMCRLLEMSGSPASPHVKTHFAGSVLHHRGGFGEARELFEQLIAERNEKSIREVRASQGIDHLALSHVWNAHALWLLGYPQKALESGQEGIRIAREYPQPFSRALTLAYFTLLQELRADADTFLNQAGEAVAHTSEHRVTYYHAWSSILLHFARAQQQPDADNREALQSAIRDFTDTGARLRMPYYLSLLARVLGQAGQFGEGLGALENAFAESQKNDEHWWDAELYRLRGELMAASGRDTADAETAFRQAIEIAQTQQAKSLELRAATSLARLLQSNSRKSEAKQLLVPVYSWFTEGFDTPDLKAAQLLLTQLEQD